MTYRELVPMTEVAGVTCRELVPMTEAYHAVLSDLVRPILADPLADGREWTIQGLGMLRTYLGDDKTNRLHVWHSGAQVPDVTMMHTHPWAFTSIVLAGLVRDTEYYEVTRRAEPAPGELCGVDMSDDSYSHFKCPFEAATCTRHRHMYTRGELYLRQRIVCGPGGGIAGEAAPVYLEGGAYGPKEYGPCTKYAKETNDIHASAPVNGTVTIIQRLFGTDTDHAYVYYKPEVGWVSAESRQATPDEVAFITAYALERWFV